MTPSSPARVPAVTDAGEDTHCTAPRHRPTIEAVSIFSIFSFNLGFSFNLWDRGTGVKQSSPRKTIPFWQPPGP